MHFLGVGGEALKVIKTKAKRQKMMKNRTKKIIFLVHKKTTKRSLLRPLPPHLPDFDVLCVLLGEAGKWAWRVWWAPSPWVGPLTHTT